MTAHNLDLPKHAADKVKRALDDVLQLATDPGELLRISLLSASVPLGAASGFFSGIATRAGQPMTVAEGRLEVLAMLRRMAIGGPDAALADTDQIERERCAEVARQVAREISKGTRRRPGSVEEIGELIAEEILKGTGS